MLNTNKQIEEKGEYSSSMYSMKYADLNDESLVMLTLAGEQAAYEVLVAKYQKAVISSAEFITHNRFMAEDAAQDAFVAAWIKLNLLNEPEKYRFWVCRIAKNCARNLVVRYRGYVDFDALDEYLTDDDERVSPDSLYLIEEEKLKLHDNVGKLPEKIGEIIRLHYFEGLSVSEIAEKMSISIGTVKSQLYDGRKKLRKELNAVNENMNDTMTERVMKKVAELKNWQLKSNKDGFEKTYNDVLSDIEELPESTEKYHALADTLMCGWWWIPGEKNDALFARLKEAALLGKNDEVMKFIALREEKDLWGDAKISFIKEKQIPYLEANGFRIAPASEWYRLGNIYFDDEKPDEGYAAYDRALELLKPSDIDYAVVSEKRAIEKKRHEIYAETPKDDYILYAVGDELRTVGGKLMHWTANNMSCGTLYATDLEIDMIFRNASLCDGQFQRDGMKVGETYTGSDGTTLCYASSDEAVETPSGRYEGCQLWITKHKNAVYKTYYGDGTGIVRQDRICDGITETRLLKVCTVSGKGIIPCAEGNTWEYDALYDPSVKTHSCRYTVCYSDSEKTVISGSTEIHRLKYDENSWVDMIDKIRNDYWDGSKCCDVSFPMERAMLLAKTPLQKAHTNAACSVAKRILATNKEFNPDCTETGHWNFFNRRAVQRNNGCLICFDSFRWSFELKYYCDINDTPLLYNDIYGILIDATGCIQSDKWLPGAKLTVNADVHTETEISCEVCGAVATKAGQFADCMKLSLNISGYGEYGRGMEYRGGKKEYYFAPGIGIVRVVNHYCHDTLTAVYELTAYTGTGKGYMPVCDGMMRRYDALDLMDGRVANSTYTYAADDNGDVVIFEDRCGVRKKPEKISLYSSVYGEVVEDELWDAGKHDESRMRHAVNNFTLLLHFLCRPGRYWGAPDKAVAWNIQRMKYMELLGDGEVPSAWLGLYSATCFRTSCALFGMGRNDEGYEYLDRALEIMPKWSEIPDGTLLDIGDPLIYGGVRVVKGEELIELPDGKREPLYDYAEQFECGKDLAYYGLTATQGWEWFNGVRDEARYKTAVERARLMTETK